MAMDSERKARAPLIGAYVHTDFAHPPPPTES
jgi:hypothetical protein